MFNVFTYLIEHFQDLQTCPERVSLERRLEKEGFEEEEIHQVFSWMDKVELSKNQPNKILIDSEGFRVFSPYENQYLNHEVINLLSFLGSYKIINHAQRELIVDTLLETGQEISIGQAKTLILAVLWADNVELPILIGDELFSALYTENTQ